MTPVYWKIVLTSIVLGNKISTTNNNNNCNDNNIMSSNIYFKDCDEEVDMLMDLALQHSKIRHAPAINQSDLLTAILLMPIAPRFLVNSLSDDEKSLISAFWETKSKIKDWDKPADYAIKSIIRDAERLANDDGQCVGVSHVIQALAINRGRTESILRSLKKSFRDLFGTLVQDMPDPTTSHAIFNEAALNGLTEGEVIAKFGKPWTAVKNSWSYELPEADGAIALIGFNEGKVFWVRAFV